MGANINANDDFIENCSGEFKDAGNLALQTVLKDRLMRKYGASWEEKLFSHIRKRGTEDSPGVTSYKNALVSLTGGEKTFSQLEITVLFASLQDEGLLGDLKLSGEELRVAWDINRHRRGVGHDGETDKSKQEEHEGMYNEFWVASAKTLQEAIEVFGFTGKVKERIEAYCSGRAFKPGAGPAHDRQFERANDYIHSGQKAEGIAILKDLAEKSHIESLNLLSKMCLNAVDYPELFNPKQAEAYCLESLLLTGEKENLLSGILKEFNTLLKSAEHSAEANLKLIEFTDNHPVIKVNDKFVVERYLCAERCGMESITEKIKTRLATHGFSKELAMLLAGYREYEFLAGYCIETKTDFKKITRPCDASWKKYIELAVAYHTDDLGEDERTSLLEGVLRFCEEMQQSDPVPAYFGAFCYYAADIFKRGRAYGEAALSNEISLLVMGASSGNSACFKEYREYLEQAKELKPSYTGDALLWYRASKYFPDEIKKKLADEYWQFCAGGINSSLPLRELIARDEKIQAAAELLACKSYYRDDYTYKYRRVYEEGRKKAAEEAKNNEIERLSAILGEKSKEYWLDLENARKEAETVQKRREEYSEIIGQMPWDFWRDQKRVERKLSEIAQRKGRYEKYFPNSEERFWRNDDKIKEELEKLFGSLTESLMQDDDMLSRYYAAYRRYSSNRQMIECRTWLAGEDMSFGNPDKYVPDEVNWEFWLDFSAVQKEEKAFAARKKWLVERGEHSRTYWLENIGELCEIEKQREEEVKKASEKAEKVRQRKKSASKVLSAIAVPFRYLLKLLQLTILPESSYSLAPGLIFTVTYAVMYITGGLLFITLLTHRILYVFADMGDEALFHISLWVGLLVCYYAALAFYYKIHDVEINLYSVIVAPAILIICYTAITNPLTYHIMDVVDVLDEMDEAIFVSLPITQLPLVTLIAAKIKEQR